MRYTGRWERETDELEGNVESDVDFGPVVVAAVGTDAGADAVNRVRAGASTGEDGEGEMCTGPVAGARAGDGARALRIGHMFAGREASVGAGGAWAAGREPGGAAGGAR